MTKYAEEIMETIEDIAEDGVKVQYITKNPHLFGQGINVDDRVESRYIVDVIYDDQYRRRDGGGAIPSNQIEFWMGSQPFKPKPGDVMITPFGKEYEVDQVRAIEPDGYPIIYNVRCIDG